MTIQHVELRGERYVILPEHEFLELQRQARDSQSAPEVPPASSPTTFRNVVPLKVGGMPASEMLIRDRR